MILGVDPGERRTGVAVADAETRWARPLEVIDSRERDPVERIAEIVTERAVDLVVVGRPVHLSGQSGSAVDTQQRFVSSLRAATSASIEEFDERLTSVAAGRRLREAGVPAKRQKDMKDAVAAQLMLQDYLDSRS